RPRFPPWARRSRIGTGRWLRVGKAQVVAAAAVRVADHRPRLVEFLHGPGGGVLHLGGRFGVSVRVEQLGPKQVAMTARLVVGARVDTQRGVVRRGASGGNGRVGGMAALFIASRLRAGPGV